MNRAWRVRGILHIECDNCHSRGTAPAATKMMIEPEAQKKIDEGHAKVKVASMEHQANIEAAVAEFRRSQGGDAEARKGSEVVLAGKLKKSLDTLIGKVNIIQATLPKQKDGVSEILENCPWCSKPLNVTLLELPEGVTEPA
jgi:hypothetical protein